jgi:ATP synthase protein I
MTDPDEELRQRIERQAKRMRKAKKEQSTLLGQTIYIGTLGLLFMLPVVGGAYLGQWLDELCAGYSMRWTLSLIVIGIVIGAVNVYLFTKE